MDTAISVVDLDHTAPDRLSVDQAHTVMQEHLRCDTATCPRRGHARQVLIEHGRYVVAGHPATR